MFKLSRFRQERFVQELCCSSFGTATASRPYSGLGTSSRALGWDPGSTGRPHLLADHSGKAGRGSASSGVTASLAEAVGHEAFKPSAQTASSFQLK